MITLERVKKFLAKNDSCVDFSMTDIKPRICEIGAGQGDVISKFEGGDLFAIEPSEDCREILCKKGATVIGESIDASNKDIEFHIILMRHVLEHVYYPQEMLEDVSSLLSENGILYIAVPNLLVPHFLNMFTYPHVSYFSKYSLTYLCDRVGVKVCKIQDEKDEIWCILKRKIIDKSQKGVRPREEALQDRKNLLRRNIEETKRIFQTYKNYSQLLKRSMTRIISNITPLGLLTSIYERRNKLAER
jgi:SAM-dependent methyltransferase